jgi:hypothetical protein
MTQTSDRVPLLTLPKDRAFMVVVMAENHAWNEISRFVRVQLRGRWGCFGFNEGSTGVDLCLDPGTALVKPYNTLPPS